MEKPNLKWLLLYLLILWVIGVKLLFIHEGAAAVVLFTASVLSMMLFMLKWK